MVPGCKRESKERRLQNALRQTGRMGSSTTETSQFSRSCSDLDKKINKAARELSAGTNSVGVESEGGVVGMPPWTVCVSLWLSCLIYAPKNPREQFSREYQPCYCRGA